MKFNVFKIVVSLCIFLFITGCIAWRHTDFQKISGVVIDSSSNLPIDGAIISIANQYRKNTEPGMSTSTLSGGLFEITGQPRWLYQPLCLPAIDRPPATFIVTVSKANYTTYSSVLKAAPGKKDIDLGKIQLVREKGLTN